ncbi:MAG: hypothetical protein G01um101419_112 [Parcubacteria group bacterium Gr01-1014_19]|nr:MAG: hypothetical protein G01um101419_112 [Parcubacteria group bacterium Gr01-1014_19]
MDVRLIGLLTAVIGAVVGFLLPWSVLIFLTVVMMVSSYLYLREVGRKSNGTEAGLGTLFLILFTVIPFLGLAWLTLLFRTLLMP